MSLPGFAARRFGRATLRFCAVLVIVSATSAHGHGQQTDHSQQINLRESVTRSVLQITKQDYEDDRAGLARSYQDLAPYVYDTELGSRARYWRGFAMWRRALNGFNDGVDAKELEADLVQGATEFDAATATDPGFADAAVGSASCLLNILFLRQKAGVDAQAVLIRGVKTLNAVAQQAPENPRMLWVLGASRWGTPPQYGGSQEKALEIYQRGLELARKQKGEVKDALEPAWGEPELLMNLGWSNLHAKSPDLDAADKYAQQALQLVPNWHYVRDILIPQIRQAKAAASTAKP